MREQELIKIANESLGEEPRRIEGVLDACETFYTNGMYDQISGDVEAPTGHFYRVDRWIVSTNSQGHSEAITYANESEAIQAFRELDRQYYEWAEEGDYFE